MVGSAQNKVRCQKKVPEGAERDPSDITPSQQGDPWEM